MKNVNHYKNQKSFVDTNSFIESLPERNVKICPLCDGHGEYIKPDVDFEYTAHICESCKGDGFVIKETNQ